MYCDNEIKILQAENGQLTKEFNGLSYRCQVLANKSKNIPLLESFGASCSIEAMENKYLLELKITERSNEIVIPPHFFH
jgi:hypothetical protein